MDINIDMRCDSCNIRIGKMVIYGDVDFEFEYLLCEECSKK